MTRPAIYLFCLVSDSLYAMISTGSLTESKLLFEKRERL